MVFYFLVAREDLLLIDRFNNELRARQGILTAPSVIGSEMSGNPIRVTLLREEPLLLRVVLVRRGILVPPTGGVPRPEVWEGTPDQFPGEELQPQGHPDTQEWLIGEGTLLRACHVTPER